MVKLVKRRVNHNLGKMGGIDGTPCSGGVIVGRSGTNGPKWRAASLILGPERRAESLPLAASRQLEAGGPDGGLSARRLLGPSLQASSAQGTAQQAFSSHGVVNAFRQRTVFGQTP